LPKEIKMSFHRITRPILSVSLGLLVAFPAFGQYGGGGTGGMGSGGGTTTGGVYTPPKGGYSSSTGIAIGAGVAAGATIGYLALRSRGTVVGCVEPSTDGVKLLNEKDKNTYALVASNVALNPGDRVALRGKKLKDDSGKPTFEVSKLVKDYGTCN
jgi:hypothetical protein